MLELRIHVPAAEAARLAQRLVEMPGVSNVVTVPQPEPYSTLVLAEIEPDLADLVLAELDRTGVPSERMRLIRQQTIQLARVDAHDADLIWADLVAEARASSRAAPRFLALMAVAGAVASIGVIQANVILIVGAMAISPDLLPIVGTCVGLVGRRPRMVGRSLSSLALGMATASGAALVVTLGLILVGYLSEGFSPDAAFLGALLSADITTAIVATAAGIAGMLAFETRASAAVGVAISVTTIPAAAFLGVALGAGRGAGAGHALFVLVLNVVCLVLGGSTTLVIQRWLAERGRFGRKPAG
jgi:uncharacterized hydrophobic protein (TIGR00271 family)